MDTDEILKTLKTQPFEPLRFHVTDGATYDIRHPDQIMVSRRACLIGLGRNRRKAYQDIAVVSNIHITRIEPLPHRKPKAR